MPAHPLISIARGRAACALLAAGLAASLAAADESAPKTTGAAGLWDLPAFIERLPDMLTDRLPSLEPSGAIRLYVRPHFGDFLHRDYVRVPVGVRDKLTDKIDSTAEVESYFTHGLGDAAGYGFSNLKLDVKCEHVLTTPGNGGLGVGLTYLTPLSRPPLDLTDGHRHLQPYVAATHPLVPAWKVLGFAGLGADFLDRTALPAHFGRNQLHANSMTLAGGVAREWPRFHGSLTATIASSALTSDEGKQVYSLRPEIVVPWRSRTGSKTQILFTLGGRAIHGPDGNEFGVSGSMRVEFKLHRGEK